MQSPGAPLEINEVIIDNKGLLGMCCCPGRIESDGRSARQRDLRADLAVIVAWRPDRVVSLVEMPEFADLGVPQLPCEFESRFCWHHWPVQDLQAPVVTEASPRFLTQLFDGLSKGERILLHCAAGLGRTGTVVAHLLMMSGFPADQAINTVRKARPGTIESVVQERSLRGEA